MEFSKAEELRKVWGDKPCIHPALKKVVETKDKVCIMCGRVVYAFQPALNKGLGPKFKSNLFN
jgi:hypothetical protein